MRIALAGNIDARGLEKDRKLITPIIESLGHEVNFLQFDNPGEEKFPLIICLEVISRKLVSLSEFPPILLVNPEWLHPESIKIVKRSFGSILCKTHESHRICKGLFGEKARYVGFISEDRFDIKVKRELRCLHVAGHSQAKNTMAVIDAWRWKRDGKKLQSCLTVVSDFPIDDLPVEVTLLSEISDEELRKLQNECVIHIQPSATEGYGHILHEAMSVNASILTTNAAPMNEIHAAYKIPSTGSTLFNSVKMHEVSAIDIHKAVQDMMRLGRNGFSAAGMPRREFLDGNAAFKKAFAEELKDLGSFEPLASGGWKFPQRQNEKCIAFIGNFENEHSTENHILWALEQGLGYEVEKLQENKVTIKEIYEACEFNRMLFWVRTPDWLRVLDDEMEELLEWCKKEGIKTIALHLDKFWSIPDREGLIGRIPFWKCAYCFTADGSRQEDFAKRGVNHFWMRPAVSEVYCHPGTPRDEYRCDVGFVGARFYHAEYPFRRDMVGFLEETYGDRFKHIEGVRGHLLNDVYASMKICVGDCFAAGTPMYVSDRLAETTGRFGFILHPKVQGFEEFPCAKYNPQDLNDLGVQIEYWLGHESQRQDVRHYCAGHVRKHDTWTIRMREVLEVVNGKKEHATSAD